MVAVCSWLVGSLLGIEPRTGLVEFGLNSFTFVLFYISRFRTTISAGFRAVTMVDGLPRASRLDHRGLGGVGGGRFGLYRSDWEKHRLWPVTIQICLDGPALCPGSGQRVAKPRRPVCIKF